jgi:sulfur relay (sulfurtransferase) complex TusBCD TusD component (DsrE family)
MAAATETVYLFTRNGLGHAQADLQLVLVKKFLALTLESGQLPGKVLFYTDGVRLACQGSPVLEELEKMQTAGVELVLCKTCLDTFGLLDQVRVGVVGGMGDILETLQKAEKVVSL